MQHFVYPENQYERTNAYGTITVEHDPNDDLIQVTTTKLTGSTTIRIPAEAAARLAGFILSKHPAIVKGDAMAFSRVNWACDAIPEPDFTVITPGHELLAATEKQDAKDDDQDMKVTVTSPGPLSARRAGKEFAEQLSKVWFDKESSRPKAPDSDPEDLGLLHPDQERRLTALREASIIFGSDLSHDRIVEMAEWILDGNTGKED